MSAIKKHYHDLIEKGMRNKEHPMLFSNPMAQAKLDNLKNQTRRTTNLEIVNWKPDDWNFIKLIEDPRIPVRKENIVTGTKQLRGYFAVFENKQSAELYYARCPYGKPGDWLWVRESFYALGKWVFTDKKTRLGFAKRKFIDSTLDFEKQYMYLASEAKPAHVAKDRSNKVQWNKRNSIHMPKIASRIWLENTEVCIERLNDISEEDAKGEGVKLHEGGRFYLDYIAQAHNTTQIIYHFHKAVCSFRSLWNLINRHTNYLNANVEWRENPWVFVIKFKELSRTGKPQICYKSGELCKHDCKGLCRESM